MQGKDKETYTGVAVVSRLPRAADKNAAERHQKTGYLPITKAAYDLTREQGFYEEKPRCGYRDRQMLKQAAVAVHQRASSGNMPHICVIVDEELESVWTGKEDATAGAGYRS